MLSNDCKKRVILALVILTISLAAFISLAFLGPDIILDIPALIRSK